jgi:hypothetical protein
MYERARPQSPIIPKIKEYAEVTLTNGTVISGHVFLDARRRIQDMLNDPAPFFAFIDASEKIILLNKAGVLSVRPLDKH